MKDRLEIAPHGDREIEIARTFNAPVARVFAAWTTPALLQRWMLGPEGWTMPVCEIDLRVGGAFRYVWRHTDGREMGVTGNFREIAAPRRLVHTELFDMDWTGGETVVTTLFSEGKDGTEVRATVLYASREARDGAMRSGMEAGLAVSYDRLDAILDGGRGLSTPSIVDVDAAHVAIVRKTVAFADMPAFQKAARASLATLSTYPDAPPLGASLTIFRPPRDGMIDYAPGVLIPRAFGLPDGIEITELPKGRAAHLRLTGPYADLPGAWGHLFAACETQGWAPAGLNWEIYGSGQEADGGTTDLYALLR